MLKRQFIVLGLIAALAAPAAADPVLTPEQVDAWLAQQLLGPGRNVGPAQAGGGPTFNQPSAGPLNLELTFEYNSFELTSQARANLETFVSGLNRAQLTQIVQYRIVGHTDAAGTAEYNLLLSQQRANAVQAFLIGLGLNWTSIQAVGVGEAEPATPNPLDPANRRVVVAIAPL